MTSGNYLKINISFFYFYYKSIYGIANIVITKKFDLSPAEEGILVSSVNFLAAIGCFMSGPLADKLGRKKAMITAAIMFIIGAVICVTAFEFY